MRPCGAFRGRVGLVILLGGPVTYRADCTTPLIRFRLGALLAAVLALASLALGAPARAEVYLVFYGHQLSLVGDKRIYLPHALIGLRGTTADGTKVHAHYEFEPTVPIESLMRSQTTGQLVARQGEPDSNEYFATPISDDTYREIETHIAFWGSPKGSAYNLFGRNCVSFVADVARTAGLDTPKGMITQPSRFLAELQRRNAARAVLPTSASGIAAK